MRHRATPGLPNAAGIKARSEMNKASSRGKNNSEGMKRSRRNQGGAQSAALSLAKAQVWESVPVLGVCCCVPSAMGQRNLLGSQTPVHPVRCAVLWCPAGATASPEGDLWTEVGELSWAVYEVSAAPGMQAQETEPKSLPTSNVTPSCLGFSQLAALQITGRGALFLLLIIIFHYKF